MRGQVLNYDTMTASGIVTSDDGQRFTFTGSNWKGTPTQLRVGAKIDFDIVGTDAIEIYLLPSSNGGSDALATGEKSPIAAGLLALFFGGLGIHKFYLGYNTEGIILLAGTIASWILLFIVIGIFGLMAIGIISLVEAIIYLTKNQEEFDRIYVQGKRPWF